MPETLSLTFDAIRAEILRQRSLKAAGKFRTTPSDPGVPHTRRLAILMEEVGEAAEAVLDVGDRPDGLAHLETELIQVAAVAVAWIEGMVAEGADQTRLP